jgi:hypothetical protein
MGNEKVYNWVSDHFNYNNMLKYNPIRPFVVWANTNSMLDEYYKKPDVNLGTTERDFNIRNSMRHIVGPALMAQAYTPESANIMGGLKEARDFYLQQAPEDVFLDLRNNQRGINFVKQNSNATPEEIMNFAYKTTLKNLDRDYNSNLYELITRPE